MAEGTEIGTAYVSILPSAQGFGSKLGPALSGEISGPAAHAGKQIESSLGGSFKKVAGIAAASIGGALAGREIFGFLKGSVDQARESNKIAAQTGAVIKSTGGIAGVTADQVDKLANSIAAKTGIDDEAISSAENLLLTFTNIRNAVGKNNDIFNQATQIAVDMGAALGGDASSNALQLGKALNDPVQGISALTRVGVTFTDQQKDQIRAMQAAGNTAGAQRIILAELNKEFGGSAAAQATASGRLKVVWGNLQELLGTKLIPIIDRAATFLADRLPGALDSALGAFSRLKDAVAPTVARVVEVITGIGGAIGNLVGGDIAGFAAGLDGIFGGSGRLTKGFEAAGKVILKVAGWVKDNLKPVLAGLGVVVAATVVPAFVAWASATIAATWPFVALGAAVVAAIALFNRFPIIGETISRVVAVITDVFGSMVAYVQRIWPQISEAISHVVNVVAGIIRTFVAGVSALWRAWGDDIAHIAKTMWNGISEAVDNALQLIRGVIQTVVALINGDWGKAWDGLKAIVGAAWDQIGNVISTAAGVIRGIVGGIGSTIAEVARGMWDPILDGLKAVLRGVIDAWNGLDLKIRVPDIPGVPHRGESFDLIPDVSVPGFLGGDTKAGVKPLAIGGPFNPREHLLVGEQGPELVRFDRGGTVIPNTRLTSAGTQQTNHFEMHFEGEQVDPLHIGKAIAWELG